MNSPIPTVSPSHLKSILKQLDEVEIKYKSLCMDAAWVIRTLAGELAYKEITNNILSDLIEEQGKEISRIESFWTDGAGYAMEEGNSTYERLVNAITTRERERKEIELERDKLRAELDSIKDLFREKSAPQGWNILYDEQVKLRIELNKALNKLKYLLWEIDMQNYVKEGIGIVNLIYRKSNHSIDLYYKIDDQEKLINEDFLKPLDIDFEV